MPLLLILAATIPAFAVQEFYVGEPVVKEGMQIVPNYLTGVEMSPMPAGMSMDKNAVHLEADVHATAAEAHGFPEDAWIPYLSISYVLTKDGMPTYKKSGSAAAHDGRAIVSITPTMSIWQGRGFIT